MRTMLLRRGFPALKLESDRMIYLDLLRVTASLAIVIYHFQPQMDFGPATETIRARLSAFTLAVDLFFFISGFVISSVYTGRITSMAEFSSFMAKRVARLVPLHWATLAVFACFGILNAMGYLPSNHPEIYDLKCAIPNLLLLHAFGACSSLTFNHVSWSISAEMGMYALFPLLAIVTARRYISLVIVAMLLALLTITSLRTGWMWLGWSFDFGVLRALPSFLLGMISFHYRHLLGRLPWAAGWLAIASLLFLAGCLLQLPKLLLLPLIYTIAGLGIAASEQPPSRAALRFAPLGQLTYGLYMLHPLVQTVLLTGVGATILGLRGVPMTVFAFVGILLLLPLSWLSLTLFERPARRWMTRLLTKRSPPSSPVAEPALFTQDSRW